MLRDHYPYYLANRPVTPNRDLEVLNKYTGEVATRVALADEGAIAAGIGRAVEAAEGKDIPAVTLTQESLVTKGTLQSVDLSGQEVPADWGK